MNLLDSSRLDIYIQNTLEELSDLFGQGNEPEFQKDLVI